MNELYFACRTCKNYIDAGYRWCYAHLERPGIVQKGQPISVEAVLQAEEYWHIPERQDDHAEWLRRDLPKIKAFLEKHRNHEIIYGEDDFLWGDDGDEWDFDWLHEEENSDYAIKSPRYFVERLGFTDWKQVIAYCEESGEDEIYQIRRPHWWGHKDDEFAAKRKFEELVQQRKSRGISPSDNTY